MVACPKRAYFQGIKQASKPTAAPTAKRACSTYPFYAGESSQKGVQVFTPVLGRENLHPPPAKAARGGCRFSHPFWGVKTCTPLAAFAARNR